MDKALNYAFCLLKYRQRSEYELRQRLKKRGFSPPEINQTILFLKEKGFLDDFQFAKLWIESRIRKPLGIRRLKQELRIKGINRELIDRVLQQLGGKYSEEETVEKLVRSRWQKLRHLQPIKARQRIFGYLSRRGFSSEAILQAIESIKNKNCRK